MPKYASVFLLICLLSFFSVCQATEHAFDNNDWQIETFIIDSKILKENKVELNTKRQIRVWLPPGYHSREQRYPVIHYLHNSGWSSQQMAEVERIQDTFQRALSRHLIKEFIFVVGDYTTTIGPGTFIANNAVAGRWQDHITDEIVPEVDSRYRTLARPESRGLTGDFWGGHGAFLLAMHRPDVFSSVYAMHPVGTETSEQLIRGFPDWQTLITASSYEDLEGKSGFNYVFLAIAQGFTPNLQNPPFYVDWSFELKDGNAIRNAEHTNKLRTEFLLGRRVPLFVDNLKQLRGIAIDWGRHDSLRGHVLANRRFTQILADYDIEHIAEEFNGDQWSQKWIPHGRVENDVLPFFQRHLDFE